MLESKKPNYDHPKLVKDKGGQEYKRKQAPQV